MWNRGNNLVGAGIVAIAGVAFAPEIIIETRWIDKADDIALFALGIVAALWYRTGQNRFKQTVAPVVLTGSAVAIKTAGLFAEAGGPAGVGDDVGALVIFAVAAVLSAVLYRNRKRSEGMAPIA